MKFIKYIYSNGIKHTLEVLYMYKIDIIIQKVMGIFLKRMPLKNIIVIESHNDFDSNGGAFYNFLIENKYNNKYKIVWLLKHPLKNIIPYNVVGVPLYRPSIRKCYYKWIAKWFTSDNDCSSKLRDDQKVIYFGHGGFGLKNCKGYINLPKKIDYICMPSRYLNNIFSEQLAVESNDKRLCYIGFPYVDLFYNNVQGDLEKITDVKFERTILWMPTFRKGGGYKRNDSSANRSLGIPLIYNLNSYYELNDFLKNRNMLLIIKIHPMQDLQDLKIQGCSNIKVLTGSTVKELDVDNYRLMKDCDAMISDYSSAAYDFLHCNKPIAYDFSDLDEYKLGLVVDNPKEFIAGNIIKSQNELFEFIDSISKGEDFFYFERQILRKKIFDFYDGNNCKRAAKLLGLNVD